ncbi:MAG: FAD-binding protein [Candidatus Peribacter sp.]|jgi:UDP-N-acetylmuramate dehydrogenase|nr:FAD-binding protein [Candidatus Peribacter sp.]MBT4393109.1 FAD-binding protein [Candidatus Peribacter sp.]MBT4600908.1 FAD-binding protein [Candidatus Peribacter sp.]MBT5148962.1 FAD-binding protein [Candidatus Peribacter sp.]MBT5638359.1 FAD-binding protein [Candidatus Peribacter sp.]
MDIQENVSLKGKTTMRIGGTAKYYADLSAKEDVEAAIKFAKENSIPLIMLGGGSNTIFADGEINALVVRIAASEVSIDGSLVTVEAAKNLPMLINELAADGFDLSPFTGILGTVGGAVFGNAGQGPKGIWIDSFIESVECFVDGSWKTMEKQECAFEYRESVFKKLNSPIIWSVNLTIPKKDPEEITAEIGRLLQQRLDTQPHVKTAGSCFKAVGDTPAWQLIDTAGLRETKSNGVHISEKHANFLINDGDATFEDAVNVVKTIDEGISEGLEVEMRFVKEDGTLEF